MINALLIELITVRHGILSDLLLRQVAGGMGRRRVRLVVCVTMVAIGVALHLALLGVCTTVDKSMGWVQPIINTGRHGHYLHSICGNQITVNVKNRSEGRRHCIVMNAIGLLAVNSMGGHDGNPVPYGQLVAHERQSAGFVADGRCNLGTRLNILVMHIAVCSRSGRAWDLVLVLKWWIAIEVVFRSRQSLVAQHHSCRFLSLH